MNKADKTRHRGTNRRKRKKPERRGSSDPGYQADNAERFPNPEDGQQAVKEAAEHAERLEEES